MALQLSCFTVIYMHPPAARITAARSVPQLCRYQDCYLLHPAFLSCCIYLDDCITEVSITSLRYLISTIVTHVGPSSSQTQLRTERETAAAVVQQSAVTNLITAAARDAVLAPACVLQMSPAVLQSMSPLQLCSEW